MSRWFETPTRQRFKAQVRRDEKSTSVEQKTRDYEVLVAVMESDQLLHAFEDGIATFEAVEEQNVIVFLSVRSPKPFPTSQLFNADRARQRIRAALGPKPSHRLYRLLVREVSLWMNGSPKSLHYDLPQIDVVEIDELKLDSTEGASVDIVRAEREDTSPQDADALKVDDRFRMLELD